MCSPDHFDIEYEINPWMHEDNPVLREEAGVQWKALHDIYTKQLGWDVQLVKPAKGLPDMVFTANGGLVYGEKVVLPHFRHRDRQPESAKFKTWFKKAGFKDFYTPKYDFEGEGDALMWNDILFAGYPWRTTRESHRELSDFLGIKVVSLQLTDARFYHLDTAFTVVDAQTVALYSKAFTKESVAAVRKLVPHVLEATDEDALAYGLNAMSDGKNIVIPAGARSLIQKYKKRGMHVLPTPIGEFQKSGGGVKCLTLRLQN